MHCSFAQLAWAPTLLPALKLLYGTDDDDQQEQYPAGAADDGGGAS